MSHPIIRPATVEDSAACVAIYAPYVEETAITFEESVPTIEAFAPRINKALDRHVWLILERDGRALGYAYTGNFRERPAYRWVCETSIYLHRDARGEGWGRRLYTVLLDTARAQGFHRAYGVLTEPNAASEALHRRLDFSIAARLAKSGFKRGAWWDIAIWEKVLDPRSEGQPSGQAQGPAPAETLPWSTVFPGPRDA